MLPLLTLCAPVVPPTSPYDSIYPWNINPRTNDLNALLFNTIISIITVENVRQNKETDNRYNHYI